MPPRQAHPDQASSTSPPAAATNTTEPFPPIDLSPSYASIARRASSSSHLARPILNHPPAAGSSSSSSSNAAAGPAYTVSSVYVDGRAEDNPPPETWRARRLAYEARHASAAHQNNDDPPSQNLLSAEDIDAFGALDDINPTPPVAAAFVSSTPNPARAQSVPADVLALHRRLTNPSRLRNTDTNANATDRTGPSAAPSSGPSSSRTPATIAPSRASAPSAARSGMEPWRQYLPWAGRGLFPGEGAGQSALARQPPSSSAQRNSNLPRPEPIGFRATFPSVTGPRSNASVSADRERRDLTARAHVQRRQAEREQADRDRRERRRDDAIAGQLENRTTRHDLDLFLAGQSDDDDDDEDHDEDDMDVDEDGADEFMWEWTGGNAATGDDGAGAMFAFSNRSTEDLPTVGGSGGTLRRGGNNRHRLARQLTARASASRSFREIESMLQDEEDAARMEEDVLHTFERASLNRPVGLRPTNTDVRSNPVVVKSKEKDSADGASSRKKRKCVHYADVAKADDEIKYEPPPNRPTYLDYTNLLDSVPLPMRFLPPPKRLPRLALTTHSSPTCPPRPCITFTFSPIPDGSDGDPYAQALRTDTPIPVACGIHYYEAEVLDAGKCGYMSVGWVEEKTNLERLVGWDKGSYGWHGDDGMSFEGCGTGVPFSEMWSTGDVVGCGIDYTKKTAFFTKNGKFAGERFKNLKGGLFPAIGLRTPGESIVVNFTGPFKYDIDNHARNIRDKTWHEAVAAPKSDLPASNTVIVPSLASMSRSDIADRPIELPRHSRLENPAEMTHAALVLDHLRQNGSRALGILRNSMRKRKWIKQSSEPVTMSTSISLHELDEKAKLDDFETIEACLIWLEQRIMMCDTLPPPLDLVNHLLDGIDPESLKADPAPLLPEIGQTIIKHATNTEACPHISRDANLGLCLLDLIRLLRRAQLSRSAMGPRGGVEPAVNAGAELVEGDGEGQNEADKLDQECLSRAGVYREHSITHEWPDAFKQRLAETIGLFGLHPDRWPTTGVAGKAYRAEVAQKVVRQIRKTILTARTAAARGEASAAFVDPARILSEPGSLPSISTSTRASKRKVPDGDGNRVEGVGEVKVEPVEV